MRFPKTKLGLTLGAAGILVIAAAPNASADEAIGLLACGALGLSYCGHGGVNQHNTHVYACDDLADGHGFAVQYGLKKGGSGYVLDTNGSKAGCGGRIVGSASNPVTYVQACDLTAAICTFPLYTGA